MKMFCTGVGVLLLASLAASPSHAQSGCFYPAVAPSACGPGTYWTHPCGQTYGPSYNLRPPFPPFQGLLPAPKQSSGCPPMMFPTHPYARSPRDYFMLER